MIGLALEFLQMIQVCHSSISMLHKQLIHIHSVSESLWSVAVYLDALDRGLDTFQVRSSEGCNHQLVKWLMQNSEDSIFFSDGQGSAGGLAGLRRGLT